MVYYFRNNDIKERIRLIIYEIFIYFSLHNK